MIKDWLNYLKLLRAAAIGVMFPMPGLGALLFGLLVASLIDENFLRSEVKQQVPDAFKVLIKSKKVKTIYVDVFNTNDQKTKELMMTSQVGVSDDLREGQTIYC